MLYRILKDFAGSQTGSVTENFKAGTEVELTDYLADIVVREGWAEPVTPVQAELDVEVGKSAAADQTQQSGAAAAGDATQAAGTNAEADPAAGAASQGTGGVENKATITDGHEKKSDDKKRNFRK